MRWVAVEAVPPGSVLGRDLYLGDRTLLRAGVRLSRPMLDRLAELGFETLCVCDPGEVPAAPPPELLTEQTKQQAAQALKRYVKRLQRGYAGDLRPIAAAVSQILDEVLANPSVLLELTAIRGILDEQEYLFAHSVRVAALSVLLGLHSGLDPRELTVLGMGAILHDVGKVRIPQSILTKQGPLTDDERALIRLHPIHGFEILRRHRELDRRAVHVAYQHHERWDGSGYPRGLKGEEIHRFARLAAVADVFDALTSPRPYRPAWPVHRALALIEEEAGRSFDPAVVRTFLARVAPYPVGTLVRLNTGEEAVVVRLNAIAPARPVVRIWCRSAEGAELDLLVHLERRIVGPVTGWGREAPPWSRTGNGGRGLHHVDAVAPEPLVHLDEVGQELGEAHELAEEGDVEVTGVALSELDQDLPVDER